MHTRIAPLLRLLGIPLIAALAACATPQPEPSAAPAPEATMRIEGVPESDAALKDALRRYQNVRPASFLGWLPGDQGVLISVRYGDVPQLAAVHAPEGMHTQLTFFDEPILQAWVSPNAAVNGAIFAKDVGGNEYYQLHFLNFADGSTRLLTDGKSRNESVVFAPDGRRYAYSSTQRTGRDFDVWVGHLDGNAPTQLVVQDGGSWYPLDFSPDGKSLLVQQSFSISDARLFLVDLMTGAKRRIEVGRGTSFDGGARFEPDGKHLLALSNALGEFVQLVRINLDDGVVVPLFPDQRWDVEAIDLSADGRYLAVMRNVDGSSHVSIHDRQQDLAEVRSMKLDYGVVQALHFNHEGTEIGMGISGPQVPGDVYSRSINGGVLTRWTRGETGGLNADQFIMPTLIRYGAHDNDVNYAGLPRQIPAYVYKPLEAGPHPVLIIIHGGPEAQSRPQFNEFIQFLLAERKMAVIVPNVRGSAGYGKTYLALDNGRLREDSVKDIGSLIGWIGTQPEFDRERIAVYGGSYGGYMVLASLVHYSDQLRAGVDIVGISNFVTFLQNTNPYRVDQRRPEYGDERDSAMREFLQSISPLTHADRIRRPLFVIQGANDPRVPASEAEQILAAVRENGAEAWYMLAPDEGHGFRKKGNKDRMGEAVVEFLDRHVLAPQP